MASSEHRTVSEIEADGSQVVPVVRGVARPAGRSQVAPYAAVGLREVGRTQGGLPVYIARDGYSHARVAIIRP